VNPLKSKPFFLIALLLSLPLSAEPERMEAIRQAATGREMIGDHGAFVLILGSTGQMVDSNPESSAKRLPPCSTFKIWNALIGFEEGLLLDPQAAFFQWDGKARSIPGWNRDLNLRDAFQASCVPAFQTLARRIGEPRMNLWLGKIGYGDKNTRAGIDTFWLPAPQRETILISPAEQAKLMHQLLKGELPFSAPSVTKLKSLMEIRKTTRGTLYGKTGSGSLEAPDRNIGWFVGFVESGGDTFVFTCQIAGETATGVEARRIVEALFANHRVL
jgi:beta-lactamase class D